MHDTALWGLGLLALSIDGVVWGIAAHAAYRWRSGAVGRWLVPGLVAGLAFVVWDHLIFAELAGFVGFARSRALLTSSRIPEIAVQIGATMVGFRVGRTFVDRIVRRAASRAEPRP